MNLKRTHTCGELDSSHIGREVTLMGWVHRRRDLGGLIFIDLRDREGLTQVVFHPQPEETLFRLAETLRSEYVVAITGAVSQRPKENVNTKISTGEVEIVARELHIINPSRVPAIPIADEQPIDEAIRLRYRYLDLRKPRMYQNLLLRHKTAKAVRDFMNSHNFLEVETPTLVCSTPEGARDYLVPSRVNKGKFYALPQSPQLFKQLLMVGGVDRYFQLARCFRDEDLRADRQPEFTQIDLEMSFVQQEDILSLIDDLMTHIFKEALNYDLPLPIPRLTHREAMERFGSDKPDMRFEMEFIDIGDLLDGCSFSVFADVLAAGGKIKAIVLPGLAGSSRKDLDELGKLAQQFGLKGLSTIALLPEGPKTALSKHLPEELVRSILSRTKANEGDLLAIAADRPEILTDGLGRFRLEMGKRLNLIKAGNFRLLWVLDFPLFHYNAEEKRLEAEHHPFTSPKPEDIELLETDPLRARANAYDIVLNGVELGSGSIRIHSRALQEKLFNLIGILPEQAVAKFGYLLEAFEFGAPPHGGIALGFDRLVAIMAGTDSIREVLAFPKNQSAQCLMTGAPVEVSKEQLRELAIAVEEPAAAILS
ncbi:MAG: aspartate--tRNA ligase [bacterium]